MRVGAAPRVAWDVARRLGGGARPGDPLGEEFAQRLRIPAVVSVGEAGEEPVGVEGHRALREGIERAKRPVFLLINKIDLSSREMLLPLISRLSSLGSFAEIVPISALRAENLDRLEELILRHLPGGVPLYPSDQITDQSERLLCAEFIREKVFQETQQEIPYVVSVMIEGFTTRETQGLVFIDATIYVEKRSQKGILIGKEGRTLRRIGESARREMESLLGSKVYLHL